MMTTLFCVICGDRPLQGLDLFLFAFMVLCCESNACVIRCRCFTLLCWFFLSRTEQDLRDCMVISVYAVDFFNRKGVKLVVGRKCSVASCKPQDWRITLQLYEHNIATWDVAINSYSPCCVFWCFGHLYLAIVNSFFFESCIRVMASSSVFFFPLCVFSMCYPSVFSVGVSYQASPFTALPKTIPF